MHQPIPLVPIPSPPGLLLGICPPCWNGGGALANFAWPRVGHLSPPGFWHVHGLLLLFLSNVYSYINMEDFAGNTSRLAYQSRTEKLFEVFKGMFSQFYYTCISSLLINIQLMKWNRELSSESTYLFVMTAIKSNFCWFRIWIKLTDDDSNTFYDHVWSIYYLKNLLKAWFTLATWWRNNNNVIIT